MRTGLFFSLVGHMHLLSLTNCIVNSHVLQGPTVTGILILMHKDIQCVTFKVFIQI